MRLLILAILQGALLALGQVTLKMALLRSLPFSWTVAFWRSMLTNWHFALCGLFFSVAGLLWVYIVRNFNLSTAYPLVSLSYVFGMIAAIVFFHEEVSIVQWMGVLLIMLGCGMISLT